MTEDRHDLIFGIYGVFLCIEGEKMGKGYRLIDLRREYPGYTGKELWMIVTDLSEDQLMEINEIREIMHLSVIASVEMGEVMRLFERNEKKSRKRKRESEISLDKLEGDINYTVADGKVEFDWLYDALDRLPGKQKSRVIYRYMYGLTAKEIAEEDGCGRCAVTNSIRKGLGRLRAELNENQHDL